MLWKSVKYLCSNFKFRITSVDLDLLNLVMRRLKSGWVIGGFSWIIVLRLKIIIKIELIILVSFLRNSQSVTSVRRGIFDQIRWLRIGLVELKNIIFMVTEKIQNSKNVMIQVYFKFNLMIKISDLNVGKRIYQNITSI